MLTVRNECPKVAINHFVSPARAKDCVVFVATGHTDQLTQPRFHTTEFVPKLKGAEFLIGFDETDFHFQVAKSRFEVTELFKCDF